jgi:hypothetical protein
MSKKLQDKQGDFQETYGDATEKCIERINKLTDLKDHEINATKLTTSIGYGCSKKIRAMSTNSSKNQATYPTE